MPSTIAPSSSVRLSHARITAEERAPKDAAAAHESMKAKAS